MNITAAKHAPNSSSDCVSYAHVLNSNYHLQGFPDAAELQKSLICAKYIPNTSKVLNPHHWGFFHREVILYKLCFVKIAQPQL